MQIKGLMEQQTRTNALDVAKVEDTQPPVAVYAKMVKTVIDTPQLNVDNGVSKTVINGMLHC